MAAGAAGGIKSIPKIAQHNNYAGIGQTPYESLGRRMKRVLVQVTSCIASKRLLSALAATNVCAVFHGPLTSRLSERDLRRGNRVGKGLLRWHLASAG